MKKIAIKHIVLVYLILLHFMNGLTQNNTTHKLQMGIILSSGLNFNKMNTKIVTGQIGTDLTIGMNIVKNINDNLGIITGFEFDFAKHNYTFKDLMYYAFNDSKILSKSDINTPNTIFQVVNRSQTPIYLSIPTMFVFRTDYIGYKRFFGKFGMRHSFVLKSMTNDEGHENSNLILTSLTRMQLSNDLAIYRGSIGIAAGMEWNYYGSSTLVFELGYYYGVNNIHRGNALLGDKEKNMTLFQKIDKTSYTTLNNTQNQLALKVSFLF